MENDVIVRASVVAAVKRAADGIVITDPSGKIVFVNPAFTTITGYSLKEAVGQSPGILKSGRHSQPFYEQLWSTIRSGRTWCGEMINRRKDGSFYNQEVQITPVEDSDGEIISYIAIQRDVTARRAAEEARTLLAAIVESSEDAIVAYTPDGIILTWNHGAERVFGYAAAEAIGKHVSMLVDPERLSGLASITGQVLRGNAVPQYEGLCRRKDGRRIDISVTAGPIRNSEGEVGAISTVLHDITERKQAEQALQSSEEKFRQLAENIREVFWLMTPGSNQFLYVSPAYEQVWGRSCQSVYQNADSRLEAIHPDDLEQSRLLFARQMQGEPVEPEYRIRTPSGQEKWIRGRAFPIRDEAGQVIRVAGIAEDVTERKRH